MDEFCYLYVCFHLWMNWKLWKGRIPQVFSAAATTYNCWVYPNRCLFISLICWLCPRYASYHTFLKFQYNVKVLIFTHLASVELCNKRLHIKNYDYSRFLIASIPGVRTEPFCNTPWRSSGSVESMACMCFWSLSAVTSARGSSCFSASANLFRIRNTMSTNWTYQTDYL